MPEYTIQELEEFRMKQLIAQQLRENAKYVTARDPREITAVPVKHRNKPRWRRR